VPLADFFRRGRDANASLLASCKRHTRPIKPEDLGLIGADHLLEDCLAMGAAEASFKYRKHLDETRSGLPYVIEAAFAYCPDSLDGRRLIAGVNFSVGIGSPFERLGPFHNLASLLGHQHAQYDDPVLFLLHYTCPQIDFADPGEGTLALPYEVVGEIRGLVEALTKDWAKQRRAKLRSAAAEERRTERLLREWHRPEKPEPPAPDGVLEDQPRGQRARRVNRRADRAVGGQRSIYSLATTTRGRMVRGTVRSICRSRCNQAPARVLLPACQRPQSHREPRRQAVCERSQALASVAVGIEGGALARACSIRSHYR
jgi:hypothetical protein